MRREKNILHLVRSAYDCLCAAHTSNDNRLSAQERYKALVKARSCIRALLTYVRRHPTFTVVDGVIQEGLGLVIGQPLTCQSAYRLATQMAEQFGFHVALLPPQKVNVTELRKLIDEVVEGATDAEMAGQEPPAEAEVTRAQYALSRARLDLHLSNLEKGHGG